MSTSTVAVDLGGTHIRAAVVAEDGTVVTRDRCSTPVKDPEPTVIPRLVKEMISRAGDENAPVRAVVGVPGLVNHEAEQLVAAPNLPTVWQPKLSEDWLGAAIGLPVAMANDADLAAVGEANFGAAKNAREAGKPVHDVVYVTISTGVGAGVVVGQRLVRGTTSGGEIGHTVIDRVAAAAGRPCTVEDLGSGTAIERAAQEAGLTARGAALSDLVRAGDQTATRIWTEAMEAVGMGIANLAWIVSPQLVVLGGGVGMNHDIVAPTIARQLKQHGPPTDSNTDGNYGGESDGGIEVVTAALGDDAALAGSAAWWTAVGRD